MLDVRPVTTRQDRRSFIDLPYRKYERHPLWVPPARMTEAPQFDPRRNPFFDNADMDLFLAWDGGRIAGRIAAIDDRRHNAVYPEDNVAGFGFFEADSREAASGLLAAVERWAAARGRAAVRGPVSPSLNHVAGLQIDAFDTEPFVMMPWNPPEYVEFIESAGYAKVKDLWCWLVEVDRVPLERLARLAQRVGERNGVVLRRFNRWRLREESDRLYELYTRAWERNWGFAPPSREEFWHTMKDIQWLRPLDGLVFAEVAGRPVGASTLVPDVNQVLKGTTGRLFPVAWWRLLRMPSLVTRARVVVTGVLPEYRDKGVIGLLMHAVLETARRHGIKQLEYSWVLEDNAPANESLRRGGGRMYKTVPALRETCAEEE